LSTIRIKHLKMLILSILKNWSSYKDYGKITNNDTKWTVTADKMKLTNNASSCTVCPLDVMWVFRWVIDSETHWSFNKQITELMQHNW
jgi:hypothetical protein